MQQMEKSCMEALGIISDMIPYTRKICTYKKWDWSSALSYQFVINWNYSGAGYMSLLQHVYNLNLLVENIFKISFNKSWIYFNYDS